MASAAAPFFSLSPSAQIQYSPACTTTTTATRKTPNVFNSKSHEQKPHKNPNFFFSSSSSSSFPITLRRFPSSPLQLQPLQDSVHIDFLENLENSTNFIVPTDESHEIVQQRGEKIETFNNLSVPGSESQQLVFLEPRRRVFIQDPPWISPLPLKGLYSRIKQQEGKVKLENRRYNLLRRRQVKAETEAWERMVDEYKELEAKMIEKKLAPNLPHIKGLFLGWFEPLREAIAREQKAQKTKKQKAAYAPHIELLPADKMAVIVMHKMMGLIMAAHEDGCVQVVQAAVHIGMAIEQEVRIHSFLEKTKSYKKKKIVADFQEVLSKEKEMLRKRVNGLIKKNMLIEVQKLLKNEETKPWGRDTQAKLGSCLIELLIGAAYVQHPADQVGDFPPDVRPAFRHKLKTIMRSPGQKITKRYGVIECDPLVLVGLEKSAKHMLIPYVPMLVPPKRWKGYDKGGYLFLPSYVMRTHGSRKQQEAVKSVPRESMKKVYEALDTLGNTKWRVNRKVLIVLETIWASGGNIAGLVDRDDILIPEKPPSEDLTEIQKWKWSVRKAKKMNRERHSQRCDTELKLSVARRMKDEEGFYYPHNLDFRGRAYPMHPHLNHLSSDLCRGVLEFSEGRPLGKSGLRWLKIHLANLFSGGVEKLSHDGRLAFVDNHLDDIFDSAENPINGNRWWLKAEDPFQCLAACINLSEALKSPSPHSVISHLPIHQVNVSSAAFKQQRGISQLFTSR
ncbi:hypothetical protein Patl1_14511 [Pistacia atlantica]|uniref:Uncharacterized protein n=1 Tax=Pistacia atlantica TaxID=434234 RepID=A0ACC1ATH2_9ROSI|nr:hypothetical protein Patl1_14511 [Pistacia atlantica]